MEQMASLYGALTPKQKRTFHRLERIRRFRDRQEHQTGVKNLVIVVSIFMTIATIGFVFNIDILVSIGIIGVILFGLLLIIAKIA